MKRFVIGVMLCLATVASGFAQQSGVSTQPTRAEVEQLFKVLNTDAVETRMISAMASQMRAMMHQMYLKNKTRCNLPPNFEAMMEQKMQKMVTGMPLDQIRQAMVPAYQKDFTRADVEAMIAFYSGSVGQEVLRKTPVAIADSMRAAMPIAIQYEMTMQKDMKEAESKAIEQAAQKACPVASGT